MNVQREIIQAINVLVSKAITNLDFGSDVAATILEVKNNKYKVSINGSEYWVIDGINCKPKEGAGVWIRIPSGKSMNFAFIEAIKDTTESSVTPQTDFQPISDSYIISLFK